MLKYYDPNFRGVHVVRATFMAWDYVGHVAWPIGGNCRGAAMLDTDFLECDTQEDIDRYVENDCQFSFDEYAVFALTGTTSLDLGVPVNTHQLIHAGD